MILQVVSMNTEPEKRLRPGVEAYMEGFDQLRHAMAPLAEHLRKLRPKTNRKPAPRQGKGPTHRRQRLKRGSGADLMTTRCPIRIDGEILTSSLAAPRIGEHNDVIAEEFGLDSES